MDESQLDNGAILERIRDIVEEVDDLEAHPTIKLRFRHLLWLLTTLEQRHSFMTIRNQRH